MKAGLRVLKPGWHSLVQDLGRVGYYRQGITLGGAADKLSFLWANRLCGNRANTAALEIMVGNVELETTAPCQIALCGADARLLLNGNPAATWHSHNIPAGSNIRIGSITTGVRVYLAVRGGLQLVAVLNSQSTVVREKLGGLCGAPLAAGDFLPILPCQNEREFSLPSHLRPTLPDNSPLRVIPALQASQLPRALKRAFFHNSYRISPQANRMGYRLTGEPLGEIAQVSQQLLSEGVLPGTVQIPPDGLPIIMHQDHQTIGGYPKIGTVIAPDLWRLAQLPVATEISFAPVTANTGWGIYRHSMALYERTLPVLGATREPLKTYCAG